MVHGAHLEESGRGCNWDHEEVDSNASERNPVSGQSSTITSATMPPHPNPSPPVSVPPWCPPPPLMWGASPPPPLPLPRLDDDATGPAASAGRMLRTNIRSAG